MLSQIDNKSFERASPHLHLAHRTPPPPKEQKNFFGKICSPLKIARTDSVAFNLSASTLSKYKLEGTKEEILVPMIRTTLYTNNLSKTVQHNHEQYQNCNVNLATQF